MGSRPRLRLRGNDGGGWVPASARTTGGGGGMRDGFPPPSLRGQALRGNDGGGWVPASARTTGGGGGMRDGFPPPSSRVCGGMTEGDGSDGTRYSPPPSLTGLINSWESMGHPSPVFTRQALRGNDGGGWVPTSSGGGAGMGGSRPRLYGGRLCTGTTDGAQLAHFSDAPIQRVNSNAILPILMARRPLPQSPLYRRNSNYVHHNNPSHRVVIGETGCSGLDTLPSPSC